VHGFICWWAILTFDSYETGKMHMGGLKALTWRFLKVISLQLVLNEFTDAGNPIVLNSSYRSVPGSGEPGVGLGGFFPIPSYC
jgi:hypothetical protein